jgi:hypothetical protein
MPMLKGYHSFVGSAIGFTVKRTSQFSGALQFAEYPQSEVQRTWSACKTGQAHNWAKPNQKNEGIPGQDALKDCCIVGLLIQLEH